MTMLKLICRKRTNHYQSVKQFNLNLNCNVLLSDLVMIIFKLYMQAVDYLLSLAISFFRKPLDF